MGKACSKQCCRKEYENQDDRPIEQFPGDPEPIKLSSYSGSFGGVPPVGYVDTPTTHQSLNDLNKAQSQSRQAREEHEHDRYPSNIPKNPLQQSRYTNRSSGVHNPLDNSRSNMDVMRRKEIPTIPEESASKNDSRRSGVPEISVIPTASKANSNQQSHYNRALAEQQQTNLTEVRTSVTPNLNQGEANGFSIYKQLESVESESSKLRLGKSVSTSNISKGRFGALSYMGSKKGDLKHGVGTQTWPDGSSYEGSWIDGKATGFGKFRLPNGDIYQGEFSSDMANGKGALLRHDGSRFEGTWWDDLQHGTGLETWPDGSKYEGGYHRGKKHGYGRYVWADKSEYCGDWQGNSMSGFGRMVWPDGRRYDGEWLNNQKHGAGKHTWPDGRRYEGEYRMDKRHGHGKLVLPNGASYIGEWFENKRHGKGVESSNNGVAREGTWEHGRLVEGVVQ